MPSSSARLASAEHPIAGWAEAIEAYFERGWTDGLPVVPATEEAVRPFLDAVGLAPDAVVLTEPVRKRVITAEKLAINAVLAGCLPAYMPVLLAVLEAMADPAVTLADTMACLGSFSPGQSFVVLAPEHVAIFARDGWTKPRIKDALYAQARRTRADLKRGGKIPGEIEPADETTWVHRGTGPDDIYIVVAGG